MQYFSTQIIPFEKVNRTKWDTLVAENDNGLIYTSYNYLNTICTNCFALIINNYEAMMPLPVKNKWGLSYLYTPPFIQQTGLVGSINKPEYEIQVLQLLKKYFKYGDVFFNFKNSFVATEAGVLNRNNFIINLKKDYLSIKQSYNTSVNYSLHKAEKAGCTYVSSNNPEEAILLYQLYNKNNLPHVADKDFLNLIKLCKSSSQQNNILIRKIINQQNELMSIVLLLKDNKRYYNLINYTSALGRQTEANYFLYDSLFKELAHQNMIFDFEGSNREGVKKFYEKLGVINQPYFHWHFNNLPFPLNIIKP